MPLEAGTTIAQLDESWPLGSDGVLQGDDHLRLVKDVLKSQFPGELGQGFDTVILATETELNYLQGLTSNVQNQIDAILADDSLMAPTGTVMTFYQVVPPTGWTQVTSIDNALFRIVNDASGGIVGGTDDPFSLDWSHVHATTPVALTVNQLPDFTGTLDVLMDESSQSDNHTDVGYVARGRGGQTTSWHSPPIRVTGANGATHTHGNTNSQGSAWAPKYANMILAVKD